MSDCAICGQPPCTCRCSLADRVERRGALRLTNVTKYKVKESINPLDLPNASLAMRELERLWRSSYDDMRWLERIRTHSSVDSDRFHYLYSQTFPKKEET